MNASAQGVGRSELGREVVVDGTRANVLIEGQGDPVVLLHGSGPGVTAWANWRGIIGPLGRTHQVIAPDMPGFGYTVPAQDFVYDREHWGRFVVRLLDVLGIPRAHIVGNSYGAAVAVEVALRAPERAERLVLMGPAVLSFPITEGLEAVWGYRPSMEAMEALLPRFVSNKGMITPELVRSRFEASARPDAAMRYETLFPAPRQDALDRLALEEKEVCEIEHEVLIIHGRDDAVIPLEVSLRAFGLVARGELGVFAPCGHWVQVEQPVRFTSLVTSWLDGDG